MTSVGAREGSDRRTRQSVQVYNRIRNLESEVAVLRSDNAVLKHELLKLRQEAARRYEFP
jgi:hypothetical protein